MTATYENQAILSEARVPAELRDSVNRWIQRFRDAGGVLPQGEDLRVLLTLVATSEFAAGFILRDIDWTSTAIDSGVLARDTSYEDDHLTDPSQDSNALKRGLRLFRNRSLVRILWRQLSARDDVWSTIESLSSLAESLIRVAMRHAIRDLESRFGTPRSATGDRVEPVILAMGKLGGGELNFSSDIDLVFLYTEEGESNGPRSLSAHEFFTRFSRLVVALLDETTADGFVYRVDIRLRPFGDSGPLVVSFSAFENYLMQHGRSWERYAYVKAKVIAPDEAALAIEDLEATVIAPFVYRRYLDYGVFESLRDMKAMIETEVQKKELQDDIKLGPGGIREIEFIVQSLQLVRGGADSQLRTRSISRAMSLLGHPKGLGEETVSALRAAYAFLREFENATQAIRDRQTHKVPVDDADRARIAFAMNRADWDQLAAELDRCRKTVSEYFAAVAFRTDGRDGDALTGDSNGRVQGVQWSLSRTRQDWEAELRGAAFDDPEPLADVLSRFAGASIQRQIDVTARRRLDRCMTTLLGLLLTKERPATVADRVISVLSGIVRRSAYVALLNENPLVLQRLVDLCGQSAYLASELARFPLLLDELLDPRLFTETPSASNMLEELEGRLARVDSTDSERMIETLAQFQRATLFRIAVADVSEKLPIMKVSDALTDLAELVLKTALDVAWRDLAARHGSPFYEVSGKRHAAGFGVIGYGKLGGIELSYGSDLDVVFLHDSTGDCQQTDGENPLDNTVFFGRLVRRLVHFLTTQTSSGMLYEVDTRLRPSGHSGLLVVSTEGFEKYQEENAWTWEHQALLRSRPVAGSNAIASEFDRIRAETLRSRVRRESLLEDVVSMRDKMRKQLDKSDADSFDLKQGVGGIADIEFLVQYLVLKHAEESASLFCYSDNIRQLDALRDCQQLSANDVAELQECYKAFRLRSHRLALDGRPALVDRREFVAERKQVTTIWTREMK